MVPTWKDFIIQAEVNRTRTLRGERNHILQIELEPRKRVLNHWLVRFGSWLEHTGCQLQARYTARQSSEVKLAGVTDVRYQNC